MQPTNHPLMFRFSFADVRPLRLRGTPENKKTDQMSVRRNQIKPNPKRPGPETDCSDHPRPNRYHTLFFLAAATLCCGFGTQSRNVGWA
jgi:hypothetical protein